MRIKDGGLNRYLPQKTKYIILKKQLVRNGEKKQVNCFTIDVGAIKESSLIVRRSCVFTLLLF